jgi:hypothetical protein
VVEAQCLSHPLSSDWSGLGCAVGAIEEARRSLPPPQSAASNRDFSQPPPGQPRAAWRTHVFSLLSNEEPSYSAHIDVSFCDVETRLLFSHPCFLLRCFSLIVRCVQESLSTRAACLWPRASQVGKLRSVSASRKLRDHVGDRQMRLDNSSRCEPRTTSVPFLERVQAFGGGDRFGLVRGVFGASLMASPFNISTITGDLRY